MANFNKTILLGRLTAEPEFRQTSNGNSVAVFRLASSRSRRNPQTGNYEDDPNPLFIDCEAWSNPYSTRLVDVVRNYCHQGTQILVSGQLRYDQWDDQETGQRRSRHKISVDDIQLLGQPGSSGQAPPQRPQTGYGQQPTGPYHQQPPDEGDDIPF